MTLLSIKLSELLNLLLSNISSGDSFEQVIVELDKHYDKLDREKKETGDMSDTDLTLAKLSTLLINCNKQNCFSKTKKAVSYLEHESLVVKSFATFTVSLLLKIIVLLVINEKLHDKRVEFLSHLSNLINEINSFLDTCSLPKEQLEKIKESVRLAEIATFTNGFEQGKTVRCSDEVLAQVIRSSVERLFKNIDIERIEELVHKEEKIKRLSKY